MQRYWSSLRYCPRDTVLVGCRSSSTSNSCIPRPRRTIPALLSNIDRSTGCSIHWSCVYTRGGVLPHLRAARLPRRYRRDQPKAARADRGENIIYIIDLDRSTGCCIGWSCVKRETGHPHKHTTRTTPHNTRTRTPPPTTTRRTPPAHHNDRACTT